jgi:CubicO group peptidase (beta-lactamase class C family)
VSATTRFQACSISKPVAVLGMLRLVEQQVLDLDADVNDVLRSWRIPPNAAWQPRITLRQLASHSAGVTVGGFPGYRAGARLPSLGEILTGTDPANTPGIRVDTLPGLQFRYAGGGTTILQQVMEDVTGRPFPELMRELVLDPLGMTCSDYSQPLPAELHDVAATAHRTDGTPVAGRWHVYPELAAAGLWTTPADLARFATAVRHAWAGTPGAILTQPLAREMLTPQIATTPRLGGLQAIGLGLFLDGRGTWTTFGHSGGNEGFSCHMLANCEAGWGAAVMTNGDGGQPLLREIFDTLARGHDWEGYEAAPVTRSAPIPAATLDAFAGDYELRPGVTLSVARHGDVLCVRAPGQEEIRFVRISETELGSFSVEATVRFTVGEDGRASELVVTQNGEEHAYRPVT